MPGDDPPRLPPGHDGWPVSPQLPPVAPAPLAPSPAPPAAAPVLPRGSGTERPPAPSAPAISPPAVAPLVPVPVAPAPLPLSPQPPVSSPRQITGQQPVHGQTGGHAHAQLTGQARAPGSTGQHALPITGQHPVAAPPVSASQPQAGRPPERVRFPGSGDVLGSPRGSYTVQREVGRGAYGAVYEALGPFDQRYALKLQVPANRPYAEVQSQWVRESQRLLRLRHPGVVYMHDAFEHDFLFYMALEWCSYTLRDLLHKPLAPEVAVELTRQLLAAVQYLHDNDIVHGDLHPGNVLITETERPVVKLADFGISQELHGRGFVRPDIVHHAIMAPELVAAGYSSRQSDIYQIGLLLYWMVVGTPALDYSTPYTELVRQIAEGMPRARAEAIGTPLGAVIAKMLRRREAFRYQSAREVWEDLRPTVSRPQ